MPTSQGPSILIGIVLKFAVDLLVNSKMVTFVTPEQKNRIIAVVGILSGVCGVVTALATGDSADTAVTLLSQAVLDGFSTFSGAVATHEVMKKVSN